MKDQDLIYAIKSGYCYFYIQTYELTRTIESIQAIIRTYNENTDVAVWDFENDPDPESMFQTLEEATTGTVMIAKNYSWFLKDEYNALNKQIVTSIQNRYDVFQSVDYRKVLIIIGDTPFADAIPNCIQRMFESLEFDLPKNGEIRKIYDYILDSARGSDKFVEPTNEEKEQILLSCRGLTANEIENALSFSLIKDEGKINPRTVSGIRAKGIERASGIKIVEHEVDFDSLKGYELLKEFTRKTLLGNKRDQAKGILLLGPPGVGKSHFCRCLGKETGLDVYELEMAELFGGLVGESEKLMKQAIDIIKANAPCILFVDEIEKALAGVGGGQEGDGGTTKRSMAQFLKFLSNDSEREGIYVVATCNDIRQLPPEWVRAERWDSAPFFIDLPNDAEQAEILKHYQSVYEVKGKPKDMNGWSGAEIKSACRIASMMDENIKDVDQFIVPVSKTMGSQIEGLRKWAENRTIPATLKIKKTAAKGKRAVAL